MARLSGNLLTEVTSDVVRPVFFVRITFSNSETLKLWTGNGSKTYGGHTYVGTGSLMSIESVDENSDLGASGIRINLSGCDSQIVQYARDEEYQGEECVVLLGAVDEDDVVQGSTVYFQGYNDHIIYTQTGEQITASLTAENKLIRFGKSNIARYTNEDQKERFAGDKGLEFVNVIAEKEVKWGST